MAVAMAFGGQLSALASDFLCGLLRCKAVRVISLTGSSGQAALQDGLTLCCHMALPMGAASFLSVCPS